ncbi:M20/M25/M40 family metallo-hydrolase [Bacteroidota bacterium]
MKFMKITLIIIIVSVSVYAQTDKNEAIKHIRSNLEFLAHDLLEGREATSRGARVASLYIARELQKYGVKPFGDNGTYYQSFDMTLKGFVPGVKIELLKKNKEEMLFGEHFIISKRGMPDSSFAGIETDVVFAGYGITAEEFDYDDYENLDIKGKIVLLYDDMPESEDETIFNPKKHKKYIYWSTKRSIAQEKGAIGVLIIPTEQFMRSWLRYKNRADSPSFGLPDTTQKQEEDEKLIPLVVLNNKGLSLLLADEDITTEELLAGYGELTFPKYFTLKNKLKISYRTFTETRKARNVIGILEGNDENLKNEFITIGGHYDHVGANGGNVYNGADDNGSGTVAILECARTLSAANDNERSILFIFHTAEEKGLLGAKYLTNNVDWVSKAVVNINIDMVGRESVDSIHCIGSDKLSSELYELVEEINSDGDYFTLDYRFNAEDDPNRYYYRSDHVHYVNKNIPIVFFYDYMRQDYHKPTDTAEKINYTKIYKITRLVHDLALTISNLDHKLIVDKAKMKE